MLKIPIREHCSSPLFTDTVQRADYSQPLFAGKKISHGLNYQLLDVMTITAPSINEDLKVIPAIANDLVLEWGGERVPRESITHHVVINLHSKHVMVN